MLAEILHALIDAAGPQLSPNDRGRLHSYVDKVASVIEANLAALDQPAAPAPAPAPVKPKTAPPVPSFAAPPAPAPDAAGA